MTDDRRFKRRILIDLGGVLNNYRGDFDENYIPEIKRGAKGFLKRLAVEFPDYEIYLYTSRNLLLASKWLIENDIDKYFKGVTNVKIPAYLTIEDRSVCFRGDYKELFDNIRDFRVWWREKEA